MWCFDKQTDRVFSPNIDGILAERRFYEIEFDGFVATLEPALSRIEDAVAPILRRIVDERSIRGLSADDRGAIASFTAIQFARTPYFRQLYKELGTALVGVAQRTGAFPGGPKDIRAPTDAETKESVLRMIHRAPQTFGPHFIDKHWYLVSTTSEDPFHLGDHPVVRENVRRSESISLSAEGITIYLPLSATLCLAMTDRALVRRLGRSVEKAHSQAEKIHRCYTRELRAGQRLEHPDIDDMAAQVRAGRELFRQMRVGGRTRPEPQVVRRLNYLQMKFAVRWVLSSRNDFSLPREMIADDEGYRRPSTLETVKVQLL